MCNYIVIHRLFENSQIIKAEYKLNVLSRSFPVQSPKISLSIMFKKVKLSAYMRKSV